MSSEHQHHRGQWGSSIGFLLAAIGSAVGLGNLWGFPFKMGSHGGFAFLIVYLVMVAIVGIPLTLGEFVIGRKTGKSVIQAYQTLNKKYTFVGVLGAIAPALITPFYCVLGGYCLKYAIANLGDVFGASWGVNGMASEDFFKGFITNMPQSIVFALLFVVLTALIVLGGVSGGIEKFSKFAMPALFVLLVVVIIRSVTLDGASDGLAFMFKPDWSAFADGGWKEVITSAAGQVFFSLSLAMGIMVTFGSYLPKTENLCQKSVIIPIADTVVAIMAGLAVMPAVFAMGLEPTGGPGLLFVTLQSVFDSMGSIGPIFGFLLYILVFIAAITSSVSLMEVLTSVHIDHRVAKKKTPNRKHSTILVAVYLAVVALLVAADGLGSNGLWTPFKDLFAKPPAWCDCWLDFLDVISEGIIMPIGAFVTSIILGWKLGPKYMGSEIELEGNRFAMKKFILFCLKFVCPVLMLVVLYGQLVSFGIIS